MVIPSTRCDSNDSACLTNGASDFKSVGDRNRSLSGTEYESTGLNRATGRKQDYVGQHLNSDYLACRLEAKPVSSQIGITILPT